MRKAEDLKSLFDIVETNGNKIAESLKTELYNSYKEAFKKLEKEDKRIESVVQTLKHIKGLLKSNDRLDDAVLIKEIVEELDQEIKNLSKE